MGNPNQPMPNPQSQRSVQNERDHDHERPGSNMAGRRMRRDAGPHRMNRRQASSVPYPSKEAYDSYVVNNYRSEYDEVYPVYYSPPAYTTTTAAPVYYSAPSYTTTTAKVEYYAPRY